MTKRTLTKKMKRTKRTLTKKIKRILTKKEDKKDKKLR